MGCSAWEIELHALLLFCTVSLHRPTINLHRIQMINSLMTKSELVSRLARRFPHLVHKDARIAVELILGAVTGALASSRRVEIRGFGSFSIRHRAPKLARNPRTGEAVAVAEKHVPHFKPSSGLLESVQLPPGQSSIRVDGDRRQTMPPYRPLAMRQDIRLGATAPVAQAA